MTFQNYTWHMTIYVISPDYTLKKLYGFVPYQSRTLLAMSYTKHVWYMTWTARYVTGTEQTHKVF